MTQDSFSETSKNKMDPGELAYQEKAKSVHQKRKSVHQKRVDIQARKFNRWLRIKGSTLIYDPYKNISEKERKQMITPMIRTAFKIRPVQLAHLERWAEKEQLRYSRYMRNVTDK